MKNTFDDISKQYENKALVQQKAAQKKRKKKVKRKGRGKHR